MVEERGDNVHRSGILLDWTAHFQPRDPMHDIAESNRPSHNHSLHYADTPSCLHIIVFAWQGEVQRHGRSGSEWESWLHRQDLGELPTVATNHALTKRGHRFISASRLSLSVGDPRLFALVAGHAVSGVSRYS
jgi:hypothetical protein